MLVPIQPSGSKPPLFFVHGIHGVMFVGSSFARVLGPEQAFPGWSQALSLVPGLSGIYLRRAFYRWVFPRCAADATIGGTSVRFRGHEVDFAPPWQRVRFPDGVMAGPFR